uniref:Uncharacterized protein n=1 Tax=Colletotrichum fructicola (strain Nara gc5) TaxID=1213859 RepID=L2FCG0_COLFN
MRAFTTIAAALLVAGGPPPSRAARSSTAGDYFSGDGIVDQYISVGHDEDIPGKTKTWHLDCGTTSSQLVPGVFAKCTVDGKAPFGITGHDATNINCPIA